MAPRKFGYRPDLPDRRDYLHEEIGVPSGSRIDLRPECSPIDDQGPIRSCTANALVGAVEFLEIGRDPQHLLVDRSRLFLYYLERQREGMTKKDSGATLRDGCKVLMTIGVCRERLWEYSSAHLYRRPSRVCYSDAHGCCIRAYHRITGLDGFRSALKQGSPVVFGFSVYESFGSYDVAKTGIVPMPQRDERLLGGHAVMAVGFDDSEQEVIVRNSWGTNWGDAGCCYFPYAMWDTGGIICDAWVVS